MPRRTYTISLYILVPLIFTGLLVLAVMGSLYLRVGEQETAPDVRLLVWVGFLAAVTLASSLAVTWYLMRPMRELERKLENLHVMPPVEVREAAPPRDATEHYSRMLARVTEALSRAEAGRRFPEIIGQSQVLRNLLAQVVTVAPTDRTILLNGETGTGKELLAQGIVVQSPRQNKPFLTLNCAAIPASLLESELFGHEKGAFSGAADRRIGKLEMAHTGTLLLDEIGDMPLEIQAKLLRVLEDRKVERLGGRQPVPVDVRFIAATNRNLDEMVSQQTFRRDLYYRIAGFILPLPPLRERREDIPLLVDHFLHPAADRSRLHPEALALLFAHNWPGNIRELKNLLEQALLLAGPHPILPAHFPALHAAENFTSITGSVGNLDQHLQAVEKAMIIAALQESDGIQANAARRLGIKERSLWHRIRKYGIDVNTIRLPS